jgi:hypothetical protein
MTNATPIALLQALGAELAASPPRASLVWSAVVDIAPRRELGCSGLGERWIVPIVGGCFWGGPAHESFRGRVLPGGADRQLLRSDGVKELRAEYELEVEDGTLITIDNRVLIDDTVQPERYALSHLHVTAPAGPHAWLNRRILVGSLQSLRPRREAVLVRGYLLDLDR